MTLLVFSAIGVVVFLALAEVGRYRLAQANPEEELAYSRARLVRRLGIAALIVAVLLGLYYKPEGLRPTQELGWLGACLVGAFLILWLTWRDLHETSIKVVDAHSRFRKEASEEMRKLYQETARRQGSKKSGRNG